MILFKNKLIRNKLIDKLLEYRSNTKYENNNFFKDYLKIIEDELQKSTFDSDSDFLTIGSREKIINEFYSVLTDNDNYNKKNCIKDPLYFALGNIQELIINEFTINTILPVDNFKELREKDIRYSNKKIICLEEKELIEKMMNDFKKAIPNNTSSINSEISEDQKYYYKFIPYKKIGPISLDKNEYLKPNGVPYLYENSLNHVLCQPLGIDYPEHIKKLKKRDYVYLEYGNTIIELTCKFEKLKNDLDKICDDIILSKEDDCFLVASSKKLGIIIIAEKNNNQEYKDEFEFYIRYIKFVGQEQFKEIEKEKENNVNDKEKILSILIQKIEELPYNIETTLAQLINYNPQEEFVEPLAQGEMYNKLMEYCKQRNIGISRSDEITGLAYYYKFKKINLKESEENVMNKEFKINDNIQFDSEETKVEFQKYLDEINEYNRKIQNGEETGVNPADLLNKYREKFYDEELENKMKELDEQKNIFKFENNEIDELKNKLDAKLKELEENNTNGD